MVILCGVVLGYSLHPLLLFCFVFLYLLSCCTDFYLFVLCSVLISFLFKSVPVLYSTIVFLGLPPVSVYELIKKSLYIKN